MSAAVVRPRRQRRAAARRDHRREPAPHRRALRRSARRWSSATRTTAPPTRELWDQTTRAARGLLARGVKKGDRVGIWSPNRYEWVVLQYATARIGAILVNINPAYKTAELKYALQQSGVSLLLLARAFRTSDYVGDARRGARRSAPSCASRSCSTTTGRRCWPTRERASTTLSSRASRRRCSSTTPINIQYTSGTTGFPKGATLSHHNILNNGFFIGEALALLRARPRLHPGAVLSLLRDGARQPRLHHARRVHGRPRRELRRRWRCWRPSRPSAARRCTACRRCSSASSTIRASPSSTSRRCAPGSWPARPARSR